MNKKKWIDDTMKSTDGMQRATPSEGLFRIIEQRIAEGVEVVKTVPLRTVSLAAASIVLLVAVNVFMLKTDVKHKPSKSNAEKVIEYYGLNEQTINY